MHKQATHSVRKATAKQRPVRLGPRKSLPQKYFVSPEVFAEEQTKIFSREWLLVGHQSQIPNAGDYVVVEIPVPPSPKGYGATSESLIVIRDKNRRIHAFFNVCRHRGSRLIENDRGNCAAIQCPYHAWTYGLDGRLIGAPHMDELAGFDKADYPLHVANIGVWEGFIFVNLADSKPKRDNARLRSEASARQRSGDFISLERWFAPLEGKFSHWNMSILRGAKRIEYEVKANWKLMFEN